MRKSIDHRDFYIPGRTKPQRKPARSRKAQGLGEQWWLEKDTKDAADAISANLSYWAQNQRARLRMLNRYARLYGNLSALGYSQSSLALTSSLAAQYSENVTLNVTGSVVDTLTSKVCRNKPKPYAVTDNGNRKAQRVAKNRNVFITGTFQENNTYAKTRIAFRDSAVWGNGIIYVHGKNGRVAHTRVMPSEIFVDEIEALANGGMPQQLHRIYFVDRSVLIEEFPQHSKMIEDDDWKDGLSFALVPSLADLVCVRESWRLPSAEGADDGRYVKTISSGALTPMLPWKRMSYPFARMSYCPRMVGWWAQGLVEQGESLQLEINKTAWTIQEGMHRMGTTKIWAGPTGTLSADQISNETTAIIESAQEPKYIAPIPVQREYFEYQEQLINRYYNLAGVSQADASSTKPKGDLSGEALELIHDIGTERFMTKGQDFEDFHCEIARLSILTAADIVEAERAAAKEGAKVQYPVTAKMKGTSKTVDFDELEYKPGEEFVIQCFPVSALPSDPAGRTQKAQEYAQAGWIDQDTARDLVDFPDTGRVEGYHNAARDFIAQTLDDVIDHGTPYTIEPYDNAPLFLELASEYYQRFRLANSGVTEERLDLIRRLIDQAKNLIAAAAAPPVVPPGAPVTPPANPMPTPTSALVPNVNA
jgi:hypothetical protein